MNLGSMRFLRTLRCRPAAGHAAPSRQTDREENRDGTLTRRGLKTLMQPIREIEGLLLREAFSGNKVVAGMCAKLYDHRGITML